MFESFRKDIFALVVELEDTLDLESSIERCEGANPSRSTFADMVELVDTRDLKSLPEKSGYRFESYYLHTKRVSGWMKSLS